MFKRSFERGMFFLFLLHGWISFLKNISSTDAKAPWHTTMHDPEGHQKTDFVTFEQPAVKSLQVQTPFPQKLFTRQPKHKMRTSRLRSGLIHNKRNMKHLVNSIKLWNNWTQRNAGPCQGCVLFKLDYTSPARWCCPFVDVKQVVIHWFWRSAVAALGHLKSDFASKICYMCSFFCLVFVLILSNPRHKFPGPQHAQISWHRLSPCHGGTWSEGNAKAIKLLVNIKYHQKKLNQKHGIDISFAIDGPL